MAIKLKKEINFGITILHLEDTESYATKMRNDLLELGFNGTLLHAPDIKSVIEICKTKQFDIIIADMMLPDGTAMKLLEHVGNDPKLKGIPILMCTTINQVDKMLAAIAAGANEYLVKPWEVDELKDKLTYLLT